MIIRRSSVMKIVNEAEADIRIGRVVRINADKFYKYMDIVYKDITSSSCLLAFSGELLCRRNGNQKRRHCDIFFVSRLVFI